jgi:hypothetical protein
MMETLDGNAVAGLLLAAFGEEMTHVVATCATCGGIAPMAEGVVYPRVPGTVVRCRACGALLMVITIVRGMHCVDVDGIVAMDRPYSWVSRGVRFADRP